MRSQGRGRLALALAGCVAACLLGAPAAGAVTIGAPLNLPANPPPSQYREAPGCDIILSFYGPPPSCTFLGNDVSGAWSSQTPRGRWVINTARVRTGPRLGPMVFTIIRATRSQAGAGGLICCTVPFESQVVQPTVPNAVNTFRVNLPATNTVEVVNGEPIEIVDYLGISLLDLNSTMPAHFPNGGSNAMTSYIAPAIRRGQERISDGTIPANNILLVNGEANPAPSGGGGGGGGGSAPIITEFDLARNVFRAANRGGSVQAAARRKRPVGTKVSYNSSSAGVVTFTVQRPKAGRRVKGKCRKRTRRNRGKRKCNLRLKGSFKDVGIPGANSLVFTGRLRGRKLKPGRYLLVVKPSGTGAKAKRHKFRIVRR